MLIQFGNLCPRNLILKIQSKLNISGIYLDTRRLFKVKMGGGSGFWFYSI